MRAARRQLIEKEGLLLDDEVSPLLLAKQLAEATDCVPFYLERVVSRLAEQAKPVTFVDAAEIVRKHLTDDQDLWEMEHFRSRLEIYYPGIHVDAQGKDIRNRDLVHSILDFLALANEPQPINAVWADLKSQHALADRHHIVQMLSSLAKDHYLTADTNKAYAFRFPLIRTWWTINQGLT